MSDTLPPDEIQRIAGGYKRPGDQLRELHRLGFWRARLAKVTNEVILERPHYDAVSTGVAQAQPRRPQVRAPQLRQVK